MCIIVVWVNSSDIKISGIDHFNVHLCCLWVNSSGIKISRISQLYVHLCCLWVSLSGINISGINHLNVHLCCLWVSSSGIVAVMHCSSLYSSGFEGYASTCPSHCCFTHASGWSDWLPLGGKIICHLLFASYDASVVCLGLSVLFMRISKGLKWLIFFFYKSCKACHGFECCWNLRAFSFL